MALFAESLSVLSYEYLCRQLLIFVYIYSYLNLYIPLNILCTFALIKHGPWLHIWRFCQLSDWQYFMFCNQNVLTARYLYELILKSLFETLFRILFFPHVFVFSSAQSGCWEATQGGGVDLPNSSPQCSTGTFISLFQTLDIVKKSLAHTSEWSWWKWLILGPEFRGNFFWATIMMLNSKRKHFRQSW